MRRLVCRNPKSIRRSLRLEQFESRLLMANDVDDAISEAAQLGSVTTSVKSVSSSLTVDTDVNMVAFSVQAGQVVDFDIDTALNGVGGLGAYIRLFNASGAQLAANNDGMAPGENVVGFDSYLRYTFPSAGTFYLGVSNYNNIAYNAVTGNGDKSGGLYTTGAYQLNIQALPVDTNDSLLEAVSIGAASTTAQTVSDSIAPDIDVDVFKFTVSAGQIVDFDIDTVQNGVGGLGSYLRLFNSVGQELASNNDAVAPGESTLGFDAYLRYTFTTAGTFYIAVSNANNTSYNVVTGNGDTAGGRYSIGDYKLIVQVATTTTSDPDDAISEAVTLGSASTTGVTTSGSISVDTDVDMFSFTVQAGQVVDFDIDTTLNGTGGLGSYIRLFNVGGTQLAWNNDGMAPGENVVGFDAYLRYTFPTGGTYYLAVSNYNNASYSPTTGNGDTSGGANATGSYQLVIQALPVDTDDSLSESISVGTLTSTGKTFNDRIAQDIDVDMYRFTVTAGQTVDFDIDTVQNGPGGLGSYIRLFNWMGSQLAANNDGVAPGETKLGFDSYLRYTFSTAGTYYIAVSNFNNAAYNAVTGLGDTAGGLYSIGDYQLIVKSVASGSTGFGLFGGSGMAGEGESSDTAPTASNTGSQVAIGSASSTSASSSIASPSTVRSNTETTRHLGFAVASNDSSSAFTKRTRARGTRLDPRTIDDYFAHL